MKVAGQRIQTRIISVVWWTQHRIFEHARMHVGTIPVVMPLTGTQAYLLVNSVT